MKTFRSSWRLALVTALVAAITLGAVGGAAAAQKSNWFAAWGFSQQGLSPDPLNEVTIRMITRPTLAGSAVRVTLENTFGAQPLLVGAAYVGQRANGALLVPGSNMPPGSATRRTSTR